MPTYPITKDAIKLFDQGIIALAEVERHGLKIDEVFLQKELDRTAKYIKDTEEELKADKIFKIWKRRFGEKTKLGSKQQLEKIIFDELGYKRTGRTTEKGSDKSDINAFEFVKEPFVKKYFRVEKVKKARGTYLLGIKNEVIDGYIYPIPNLHTAITYRSSYDRMNIQNFPTRDEEQKQIVRRCIIPPKGYDIGEIDYAGIEVCVSACYHKDPNMLKYIKDPTTDMHRDMAMQCYKLKKEQVTKEIRYNSKNKFVFPQFYGSFYIDCARSLWEAISLMDLETTDGIPLKKHLKANGIRKLGLCDKEADRYEPENGSFEKHIKDVEKDFWGNRFKVYKQWKTRWWEEYVDCGEFPFLTGFVSRGLFDRKQVCNSPIQGSAFHCLLWSLIRLNKWLKKNKFKSRIIAEIHDSLVLYFYRKETDDVLHQAKKIMTEDIIKCWDWILVPLGIEAEISLGGASWAEKVGYAIK